VVFPVYNDVNDDFGTVKGLNFAGKLYLLLYDTDIDVMAMTGKSRTSRVGMDFSKKHYHQSRNPRGVCFYHNQKNRVIDSQGNISESKFDAESYLLGIRYLTASDTTFILSTIEMEPDLAALK